MNLCIHCVLHKLQRLKTITKYFFLFYVYLWSKYSANSVKCKFNVKRFLRVSFNHVDFNFVLLTPLGKVSANFSSFEVFLKVLILPFF